MLNEYDYNEWFRKELDDLTLKGDKKRFRWITSTRVWRRRNNRRKRNQNVNCKQIINQIYIIIISAKKKLEVTLANEKSKSEK